MLAVQPPSGRHTWAAVTLQTIEAAPFPQRFEARNTRAEQKTVEVIKHLDVFPVLFEAPAPFASGVDEPYEPQSEIQPPKQFLYRVPIDVVRPEARVMTNGHKRGQWVGNVLTLLLGPHDLARKNRADLHPAQTFTHYQVIFHFFPLYIVSKLCYDVF